MADPPKTDGDEESEALQALRRAAPTLREEYPGFVEEALKRYEREYLPTLAPKKTRSWIWNPFVMGGMAALATASFALGVFLDRTTLATNPETHRVGAGPGQPGEEQHVLCTAEGAVFPDHSRHPLTQVTGEFPKTLEMHVDEADPLIGQEFELTFKGKTCDQPQEAGCDRWKEGEFGVRYHCGTRW